MDLGTAFLWCLLFPVKITVMIESVVVYRLVLVISIYHICMKFPDLFEGYVL